MFWEARFAKIGAATVTDIRNAQTFQLYCLRLLAAGIWWALPWPLRSDLTVTRGPKRPPTLRCKFRSSSSYGPVPLGLRNTHTVHFMPVCLH